MVSKHIKHNINWKEAWEKMQAEKMRLPKIKYDPLFKEKLLEDYFERAKSNNYEYGRNVVSNLNKVLSENFKVLEIGPGPGTLTIPLARKVKKILAGAGYAIVNIDATVTAARPKLAPFRDRMRQNLGRALTLPPERISVKAKSGNNLGIGGRGEGITAQAVALIEKQHDK